MGFNLLPMPWLSPPDPQEAFARGFQMYGQVVDDQMRKQQLSQQKQALDMRHAIEAQEMQLKQAEEKRRAEEAAQEMLFSTELSSSLNKELSSLKQIYGDEIPPEVLRKASMNAFITSSRHLPVKQASQTFNLMERLQSQEEKDAAAREARRWTTEYVQQKLDERQDKSIQAKESQIDQKARLELEHDEQMLRMKQDWEKKQGTGEWQTTIIPNPITGEVAGFGIMPPRGSGTFERIDKLSPVQKMELNEAYRAVRDAQKFVDETQFSSEKDKQEAVDRLNALKNRQIDVIKKLSKVPAKTVAPQNPAAAAPPPPPTPAPAPASGPNPLDKISDEDDVFGIKDNNMSYPARKKPFFYRTPEGLVPKMTNTPAGLTDNAAMQVAAEKNRLDQGEPLLPPPTGDPEALSAAIKDNIFQQANTQDYRTPDTMDEEVDAERAKQFEAPAEPEDTRDEVQKLLDRGREAFPGLEVLPAPVKRQASNKLLKAAAEIEAKDHPELAKKSPEDILRIVVDELKADAKGYLSEIRKALKK